MAATESKQRRARRVVAVAVVLVLAAGALWLWLELRKQNLLPEAFLVQPCTAALLTYTLDPEDPALTALLGDRSDTGVQSSSWLSSLKPGQLQLLLPLRLIAVLGPARGGPRALTVGLSWSRAVPFAEHALGDTRLIETHRGQEIRAPGRGPGYLAAMPQRLLWSSRRSELRGAIDRLGASRIRELPDRFRELADDMRAPSSGALYLLNDGRPFSIADGAHGDTRMQLPVGFLGLALHFDLVDADTLIGRGRLRFRARGDAAAQEPAIRALLEAAKPAGGELRYRIEPAGAADLSLTLRCSGLRGTWARMLSSALRPLAGRAPSAR
jgi:hypothetical protein